MSRHWLNLTRVLMCIALAASASAETVEETYAKLCSDGVRSETCDVLRKALVEKLTGVPGAATDAVSSPSRVVEDDALLRRWGVLGKEAALGAHLLLAERMSPDAKFSTYYFGAMLIEYEWISELELKKTTSPLEVVSYAWGDGASGTPSPDQNLITSEEVFTLNEAQGKIDVVQKTVVAGAGVGTEIRSQIEIVPLEKYGEPTYMEYAVGGDQHYVEGTYEGQNRQIISGKIKNAIRMPDSYIRVLVVQHLSREQINSIVASESQKFYSTISAFHKKEAKSDGWLKALIGAGVGLAIGEAYGLDSTQTVGAMMKGIEVTGGGNPPTAALGGLGDQLIAGQSSASAVAPGPMNSGSTRTTYPTKPNLAVGACSGFTEANYRQKALAGGGDSQLYTMCGRAFEYYTMYKRAIAQGYSEQDANRTYAAHEQSARVASGYLQSHGAR